MTAHVIVSLTITAPDALLAYKNRAGAALAKHEGAVVQASRELTLLEGQANIPTMIVVLAFPDAKHAQGWMSDETLQDTHMLRRKAGQVYSILLT